MAASRYRVAAVLTAAATLATAAGCSSGHHRATPASRSQSGAPATSAASPGSTGLPPSPNPLTGVGPRPTGPVVAVKVDNAPGARPLQRGLSRAAIVYQELVEGGATRYMAMFVGRGRFLIGPCRSARLTDLQILASYGRVLLGFSGANSHVLAAVHKADVVDGSQSEHPAAYELRGRRPEAFNFYTSLDALEALGGHPTGVRDVGLRFGRDQGGRPARAATVPFNESSTATLRWDAGRHVWRLAQNGTPMDLADGTSVTPANVVVQYVRVTKGAYHDVLGNYSPDSATVGSGRALVFRDGHVRSARWVRPSRGVGTRYVDGAGRDVLLHPGRTWIMLVPTGARVTTSH